MNNYTQSAYISMKESTALQNDLWVFLMFPIAMPTILSA